MTSLRVASVLCLVVASVLVLPEAAALELPIHLTKAGSWLPVLIVLGVVCCLVIGVVLRAFCKPEAELSLNQPTKERTAAIAGVMMQAGSGSRPAALWFGSGRPGRQN